MDENGWDKWEVVKVRYLRDIDCWGSLPPNIGFTPFIPLTFNALRHMVGM